MADHLPAGSAAGLPALRAGRTGTALLPRQDRGGTQHAGQFAGPQMGVHLHDARDVRRRVLRLVPALLLHLVRRRLLCVDDHSAEFRHTARRLPVPPQGRQRFRRKDVRCLPDDQRHRRSPAAGHSRRDALHGCKLHGGPPQLGQRRRQRQRSGPRRGTVSKRSETCATWRWGWP